MGEEVRGVPEAPAVEPDGSIGRYLARQRRLRGISLDELETLTKIPRRSLERLESGAFDGSPDGFARGFVRTVAAALGLDPEETLLRWIGEPEAEDGSAVGGAGAGRLAAAAAALVLLVALLSLAAFLLGRSGEATPAAEPETGTVLRRDPVRALARERAGADVVEPAPEAR